MKRRNFIQASVWGATGVTLAASIAPLVSCSDIGRNKKISLALVGCSSSGVSLITSTCKENQDVVIKYIYDFDLVKAREAIRSINKSLGYAPELVRDMKNIFDDKEIYGIYISLPEHWRALATIWSCQAGKDVYVESIPSLSIWEGQKMKEAAKKHKRVVQCGFPLRSVPYALLAKDYITSGQLGQVVHIKVFSLQERSSWVQLPDSKIPEGLDWDYWLGPASNRPYNAGIYNRENQNGWKEFWEFSAGIMSQASPALDLARMVIGDPGNPSSVYCLGSNPVRTLKREVPEHQIVTYDYKKFTMTCETGTAYNYMRNTPASIDGIDTPFKWLLQSNRVEIYGTKGLMYIDVNGGGWQVFGNSGKILAREKGTEPQKYHLQNFIDCIRNRNLPNGNVEQGYLSATLAHMGNIAYRVGNKQLLFDGSTERFTNNEQANNLLKPESREGFWEDEKMRSE